MSYQPLAGSGHAVPRRSRRHLPLTEPTALTGKLMQPKFLEGRGPSKRSRKGNRGEQTENRGTDLTKSQKYAPRRGGAGLTGLPPEPLSSASCATAPSAQGRLAPVPAASQDGTNSRLRPVKHCPDTAPSLAAPGVVLPVLPGQSREPSAGQSQGTAGQRSCRRTREGSRLEATESRRAARGRAQDLQSPHRLQPTVEHLSSRAAGDNSQRSPCARHLTSRAH